MEAWYGKTEHVGRFSKLLLKKGREAPFLIVTASRGIAQRFEYVFVIKDDSKRAPNPAVAGFDLNKKQAALFYMRAALIESVTEEAR